MSSSSWWNITNIPKYLHEHVGICPSQWFYVNRFEYCCLSTFTSSNMTLGGIRVWEIYRCDVLLTQQSKYCNHTHTHFSPKENSKTFKAVISPESGMEQWNINYIYRQKTFAKHHLHVINYLSVQWIKTTTVNVYVVSWFHCKLLWIIAFFIM